MTDEEKAEKYADYFWGASPSARRAIKQAYLDGLAEVRKENEDLKKQIGKMKCCENCKNKNSKPTCFFCVKLKKWELAT